jgi:hypothetical protein
MSARRLPRDESRPDRRFSRRDAWLVVKAGCAVDQTSDVAVVRGTIAWRVRAGIVPGKSLADGGDIGLPKAFCAAPIFLSKTCPKTERPFSMSDRIPLASDGDLSWRRARPEGYSSFATAPFGRASRRRRAGSRLGRAGSAC